MPDVEGKESLAGQLSHPSLLPKIPAKYIGLLSRFTTLVMNENIDLLVMLSGPEPQRTILEEILLEQLKAIKLKTVLLRGLPAEKNKIYSENKLVEILNHLPANDLNKLICSSNIIVSRSGYSTVMDIAVLQKQSILIPTPGQTEQEYLAKYLAEKNYCITVNQEKFDLQKEIEKLNKTTLSSYPILQKDTLKNIITGLK